MTVPGSVLAPKATPLPLSQVRRQLSLDFCYWCAFGGQQGAEGSRDVQKGRATYRRVARKGIQEKGLKLLGRLIPNPKCQNSQKSLAATLEMSLI